MPNDKYEYQGKVYSGDNLRAAYPNDFDALVANGTLKKVEEAPVSEPSPSENMYLYDGKEYAESKLRAAYPNDFESLVQNGVLKKKDSTKSALPSSGGGLASDGLAELAALGVDAPEEAEKRVTQSTTNRVKPPEAPKTPTTEVATNLNTKQVKAVETFNPYTKLPKEIADQIPENAKSYYTNEDGVQEIVDIDFSQVPFSVVDLMKEEVQKEDVSSFGRAVSHSFKRTLERETKEAEQNILESSERVKREIEDINTRMNSAISSGDYSGAERLKAEGELILKNHRTNIEQYGKRLGEYEALSEHFKVFGSADFSNPFVTMLEETYNAAVSQIPKYAAQLVNLGDLVAKTTERGIVGITDAVIGTDLVSKYKEMDEDRSKGIERIIDAAAKTSEYMSFNVDPTDPTASFIGNTLGQLGIQIGATAIGGPVAGVAVTATMMADAMYNDLKEQGVSHSDAQTLALAYSAITTPVSYIVPAKIAKKFTSSGARKAAMAYIKSRGVTEVIDDKLMADAVKFSWSQIGKTLGKEIGAEAIEEGLSEGYEYASSVGLKYLYNLAKGSDVVDDDFNWGEFFQNVGYGALGGAIASTAGSIAGVNIFTPSKYSVIENALLDSKVYDSLLKQIDSEVKTKRITPEVAGQYRDVLGMMKDMAASIPNVGYSEEQKSSLFNLLVERKSINEDIKGADLDLVPQDKKDRLEQIKQQVQAITSVASKTFDATKDANSTFAFLSTLPTSKKLEVIEDIDGGDLLDGIDTKGRNLFEVLAEVYHEAIGKDEAQRTDAENQLIQKIDNAIQEQAAGQVPVQPETTTGEEMEERAPEAELEETAQEGEAEEVITDEQYEAFKQGNLDVAVLESIADKVFNNQDLSDRELEITQDEDMADLIQSYIDDKVKKQRADKPKRRKFVSLKAATLAANIKKSVASIFPDADVLSFDSLDEINAYIQKNIKNADLRAQGTEGGFIVFDTKTKKVKAILINREFSDETTLPHEVWHGLLLKAFGDNPKLFRQFRAEIINTLRDNGYGNIADELTEFTKQYDNDVAAEEFLAQLGALLTNEKLELKGLSGKSKSLITAIRDLINKYAEKIFGEPVFLDTATPENILDFMITISDSMSKGESLEPFFRKAKVRERKKPAPKEEAKAEKKTTPKESDPLADVESTIKAFEGVKDGSFGGVELRPAAPVAIKAYGKGLVEVFDNGEEVGALQTTEIDDDKNAVKGVFVIPENRKRGVAKKAYILSAIINGDIKSGEFSDEKSKSSFMSNEAAMLWKSLSNAFDVKKVPIAGSGGKKFRYSLTREAIAKAYHAAKAKPENQRTEQESELITSVENLLTPKAEKKTTPKESKKKPAEKKKLEVNVTEVFKNEADKDSEEFSKISEEFKNKAVAYEDGVNDPKFIEGNTSEEEISIDDIVPTQDTLSTVYLEKPSEGTPIVIKVGNKYYVEDGHHRIGNKIQSGSKKVKVRVYGAATPALVVSTKGLTATQRAEIDKLKKKRASIEERMKKFRGETPKMVKARADIAEIDKQIAEIAARKPEPKKEKPVKEKLVKKKEPAKKGVAKKEKPAKEKPVKKEEVKKEPSKIEQLKSEKRKLTGKALKQFPSSPLQKKTLEKIDEINEEIKKAESKKEVPSKRTIDEIIEDYDAIDAAEALMMAQSDLSEMDPSEDGYAELEEDIRILSAEAIKGETPKEEPKAKKKAEVKKEGPAPRVEEPKGGLPEDYPDNVGIMMAVFSAARGPVKPGTNIYYYVSKDGKYKQKMTLTNGAVMDSEVKKETVMNAVKAGDPLGERITIDVSKTSAQAAEKKPAAPVEKKPVEKKPVEKKAKKEATIYDILKKYGSDTVEDAAGSIEEELDEVDPDSPKYEELESDLAILRKSEEEAMSNMSGIPDGIEDIVKNELGIELDRDTITELYQAAKLKPEADRTQVEDQLVSLIDKSMPKPTVEEDVEIEDDVIVGEEVESEGALPRDYPINAGDVYMVVEPTSATMKPGTYVYYYTSKDGKYMRKATLANGKAQDVEISKKDFDKDVKQGTPLGKIVRLGTEKEVKIEKPKKEKPVKESTGRQAATVGGVELSRSMKKSEVASKILDLKKELVESEGKRKKEIEKEISELTKLQERLNKGGVERMSVYVDELSKLYEDVMSAVTEKQTKIERAQGIIKGIEGNLVKGDKDIFKDQIEALKKEIDVLKKRAETYEKAMAEAGVDTTIVRQSKQTLKSKADALKKKLSKERGFASTIKAIEKMQANDQASGKSKAQSLRDAKSYLENSNFYKKSDQTVRENAMALVDLMHGQYQRKTPSAAQILGNKFDVKNISVSAKQALSSQIRAQSRAISRVISKQQALASKAYKNLFAKITKDLFDMVYSNNITVKQAGRILKKFSQIDFSSDISINEFVDFATNVIQNANYVDESIKMKAAREVAKKNIPRKVGNLGGYNAVLTRLFSMSHKLIPPSVMDRYKALLKEFGEKKAVLSLRQASVIMADVDAILAEIDREYSLIPNLQTLFDDYQDKVLDKNGKILYQKTIDRMRSDDIINDDDRELMIRMKDVIMPYERDLSPADIEAERAVLVPEVQALGIAMTPPPGLSKDEKRVVRELSDALKDREALMKMSPTDLRNLKKVIDNINNGNVNHLAKILVERVANHRSAMELNKSITSMRPLWVSSMVGKVKSFLSKKTKYEEMANRTPLFFIDQVFGDFKTSKIYDTLFEKIASAQSVRRTAIKRVSERLSKAQHKLERHFKYNQNAITESRYKMTAYLIQKEFESNPDSNQVNSALDFLNATIKYAKTNPSGKYTKNDAKLLEKIRDEYAVNGKISTQKILDSFSATEKGVLSELESMNSELLPMATHTGIVVHGRGLKPLNAYTHHVVLNDPSTGMKIVSPIDRIMAAVNPSTRAGSLTSRTGAVNPIEFDAFSSVYRASKDVMTDYYMTEPIRSSYRTLKFAQKDIEQGYQSKIDRVTEAMANVTNPDRLKAMRDEIKKLEDERDVELEIAKSMFEVLDKTVRDVFIADTTDSTFIDDVVSYMTKWGYRSVLAKSTRAVSEFISNATFALLVDPKSFVGGVKYSNLFSSGDGVLVMQNVGAVQLSRVYPQGTLTGRMIDSTLRDDTAGIKSSRAKSDAMNFAQQIANYKIGGKIGLTTPRDVAERVADKLITTPDQAIMRPIWFGTFAREFKSLTGKEVDFQKIKEGDEQYMSQYYNEIQAARKKADKSTILAGSTDNPFLGTARSRKLDGNFLKQMFSIYNNYMTRFLITEFNTFRYGMYAAIGRGDVSRSKGAAIMAAVASRMVIYTMLSSMLANLLMQFLVGEEEDKNTVGQEFSQALLSAATGLILGRDFGNIAKTFMNAGVEYLNMEELDDLRTGEYDMYQDQIAYTILPINPKPNRNAFMDMFLNSFGPLSPMLRTSEFAFRQLTEGDKKTYKARKRDEMEDYRLMLEIAGNLGYVPLYGDLRRMMNSAIYNDLKKRESKGLSKEKLKEANPELYDMLYGSGSLKDNVSDIKKEMKGD